MWRNATHGKDEALRIIDSFIETIPVAAPLMGPERNLTRWYSANQISNEERDMQRELLDWLYVEFRCRETRQEARGLRSAGRRSV
jgi:hypothetical protein